MVKRKSRKESDPEKKNILLWMLFPKLYPKPHIKFYSQRTSPPMIRVNYVKSKFEKSLPSSGIEDMVQDKATQTLEAFTAHPKPQEVSSQSKESIMVKSEPIMDLVSSPNVIKIDNMACEDDQKLEGSMKSPTEFTMKSESMEYTTSPGIEIEDTTHQTKACEDHREQSVESPKEFTIKKSESMEFVTNIPLPCIEDVVQDTEVCANVESIKESMDESELMPNVISPAIKVEHLTHQDKETQTSETPNESTMIKMSYLRTDRLKTSQYIHKNKMTKKKKYTENIRLQRNYGPFYNLPNRLDPFVPRVASTQTLPFFEPQIKFETH